MTIGMVGDYEERFPGAFAGIQYATIDPYLVECARVFNWHFERCIAIFEMRSEYMDMWR